jgi:hypothetical protein
MSERPIKAYPTLGCCGLDCGLCSRYYTVGTSRCPGCCGPEFFDKMPSCAYITCCVKKKGLEVCAPLHPPYSSVIPAEAGIQTGVNLDSRLRGNDKGERLG